LSIEIPGYTKPVVLNISYFASLCYTYEVSGDVEKSIKDIHAFYNSRCKCLFLRMSPA